MCVCVCGGRACVLVRHVRVCVSHKFFASTPPNTPNTHTQGHYTEGAELIDSVLDVVRKEVGACVLVLLVLLLLFIFVPVFAFAKRNHKRSPSGAQTITYSRARAHTHTHTHTHTRPPGRVM